MDSQVNTSKLQNQNLHMDLQRVAKRIRKSAHKLQKAVNFTHIISYLCGLALGGQMVKILTSACVQI